MIKGQEKISKIKQNKLLRLFAYDSTATLAGKETKVSRKCANRWFNHFRECVLEHTGAAPRFSGEVEMDVSTFGGPGQLRTKKEREHINRLLERFGIKTEVQLERYFKKRRKEKEELKKKRPKIKVLCIIQRGGKIYTHIIPDESRKTLMPVIYMVVEEGSTIYTDEWRAYDTLKLDKYEHKKINASERFSDRHGTHINTVGQFHSSAKRRLRKFNGIHRRTFLLHLKECEFRYNLRDNPDEILASLKRFVFKD